jgi:hypothetical protein
VGTFIQRSRRAKKENASPRQRKTNGRQCRAASETKLKNRKKKGKQNKNKSKKKHD